MRILMLMVAGWMVPAVAGFAGSPWREPVSFSVVSNVPFGRSVYVVGNHPDLKAWNPVEAFRLSWNPGDVWTGEIAVQAGTELEYKFMSRTDSAATSCDDANADWMEGANLAFAVPGQPPAPYTGKTIFYHSSWTQAFVFFRMDGIDWTLSPAMENLGEGRFPGESLFRIEGLGNTGSPIQFVFTDRDDFAPSAQWDNAPHPGFGDFDNDYYTPLDVFMVQDGDVFNYVPAPSVSPPTIVTQFINSSIGGIPGRNIKVFLPRGYTQNTHRFYPVVYLHDGQNVFSPGGTFGSWDADITALREMSQGRVREAILVGIDNSGNRMNEYRPPGDTYSGQPGIGHLYTSFVIHNVRPTLDSTYRTLSDPANTVVGGSSLGGLISTYFGLNTNGVFGRVGAFSPSYWIAPNYRDWLASNDTHGLRLYMDAGSTEGTSMWDYFWPVRTGFLSDGYVENLDIMSVIGCGEGHNEAAWRRRFPIALRFLLPILEEPNRLAAQTYPPVLEVAESTSSDLHLEWEGFNGFHYQVQTAPSPLGPWSTHATFSPRSLPWFRQITTNDLVAEKKVFRVIAAP